MACFPVIQMTEGEWRSSKYWDVLGVNISLTFTDDPDLLANYIPILRRDQMMCLWFHTLSQVCAVYYYIRHLTQYIASVTSV